MLYVLTFGILYFFGSIGNQIYQIGDVVNSLKQFEPLTNISFLLAIILDIILLSIAYFGITKISKICYSMWYLYLIFNNYCNV